ncbi:uncharacterized protein LOC115027710 [Cottoperca gobio]|uniref:Uncharacterized protein LOC115027710 n=1 Tax=Cottoperca gobio TaxID=56716 RepID=A0A6J2S5Q0_COTGO|nr:uncharacterized protein LOC115027710 [Cottoperca gobio]
METYSCLLLCILVTCSVWTVNGRSFEVNVDDQEPVEVEISGQSMGEASRHTHTHSLRGHCSLSAMETYSCLLVCILVTCSVWTVNGRSFEVNVDDQEPVEVEISVKAGKLPGVCWACKWALNKVKKVAGRNATVEKLTSKLKVVCDQIGLLKSLCRKFVTKHLAELIEELTTTDDVKTICVYTRACKSKELLEQVYPSDKDDFQIQINEYPRRRMHE